MLSNENEINKSLPVALYYQLYESIRRKIISKEWKEGSRLPSEADICEMYGVSRVTVRKALDELTHDGYIEKVRGRGTFVRKRAIEQQLSKFYSFSEELKKQGMDEGSRMLQFTVLPATGVVAKELKVAEGTPVFEVCRARYVNGKPYAYECSYIPEHMVTGMTSELVAQNGLYRTMRSFGVYMDSAQERFRAIALDDETAQILEDKRRAPAIEIVRITHAGIEVVEYCESIIRGDFFSYTVELR